MMSITIVFADVPAFVEHDVGKTKTRKRSSTGKQQELEIQLQRSRGDRQNIYEEMQTSQEELKSANEELQSTNEELQSTNEELSTSKEEMQNLNEELQTVNIELQSKVSDFVQANNDMKNLLNSTEIATLFLDKELNIRRFTNNVVNIFKLRNMDIGRPFTDIVTDLQYPELDSHARQVIKTLISIETAITTNDQRWFNVRIMPYRTLDDHIDGLVITFGILHLSIYTFVIHEGFRRGVCGNDKGTKDMFRWKKCKLLLGCYEGCLTFSDITVAKKLEIDQKKLNEALTLSETSYRNLFESAKDGMPILDAKTGKIMDVNRDITERKQLEDALLQSKKSL